MTIKRISCTAPVGLCW